MPMPVVAPLIGLAAGFVSRGTVVANPEGFGSIRPSERGPRRVTPRKQD